MPGGIRPQANEQEKGSGTHIDFAVQSIELVLAHRLAAIFILEDDATLSKHFTSGISDLLLSHLPAEGSLPLTPCLLGLGLRILRYGDKRETHASPPTW